MKLSQRMEYTLSPDKEFFPKILLTNDDGIDAPGFLALERALSKVADVYVLAPDGNRSAVSTRWDSRRRTTAVKPSSPI